MDSEIAPATVAASIVVVGGLLFVVTWTAVAVMALELTYGSSEAVPHAWLRGPERAMPVDVRQALRDLRGASYDAESEFIAETHGSDWHGQPDPRRIVGVWRGALGERVSVEAKRQRCLKTGCSVTYFDLTHPFRDGSELYVLTTWVTGTDAAPTTARPATSRGVRLMLNHEVDGWTLSHVDPEPGYVWRSCGYYLPDP